MIVCVREGHVHSDGEGAEKADLAARGRKSRPRHHLQAVLVLYTFTTSNHLHSFIPNHTHHVDPPPLPQVLSTASAWQASTPPATLAQ